MDIGVGLFQMHGRKLHADSTWLAFISMMLDAIHLP